MAFCLDECDLASPERSCRMGYGCATSFMLPAPVCIPGCTDESDCSDGLACDPMGGFVGAGSCYDPTSSLGDACADVADCPSSSYCLTEDEAGWPGGACIGFGCDPDSGTGCDGDAVCLRGGGGGGGACADGCSIDSDCRDGYSCEPSAEHPELTYCAPACTDDAQCTGGRVCNPAAGTCDVPFDRDDLGRACSSDPASLCAGGTCRTEFSSGFPGSYCFYDGCDTSAEPTAAGCPGDGVCVAVGDGTSGICLDGCVALADCPRDGYDCIPSDRADPTSPTACMPACTTDASCANMGFVCNEGTGLCRPDFDETELGVPCDGPDTCSAVCSRRSGCASGGVCLREEDEGWPAGTCTFRGCRLSGTGPAEACPTGGVCVDDTEGNPEIGVCLTECTVGMSGGCRAGYACVDTGTGTGACRPACTTSDCTGGRTCSMTTGLCE